MNVVRREPLNYLNQFQNEINRLFRHDALGDEDSNVATSSWMPAVDIKEEDKHFLIRADIPGVEGKDIDVTMENGLLSIRGERKDEKDEAEDGYRRVERSHGTFYRRFSLPDSADGARISAISNNGVLEVTIPKREVAQPKKIKVAVK